MTATGQVVPYPVKGGAFYVTEEQARSVSPFRRCAGLRAWIGRARGANRRGVPNPPMMTGQKQQASAALDRDQQPNYAVQPTPACGPRG